VTFVVLATLADPRNYERLVADTVDDAAVKAARSAADAIRGELDDVADLVGRGELSPALAAKAEPDIQACMAEAERRLTDLVTPDRLRSIIGPADDIAARWAAIDIEARRAVIKVLVPGVLGELRLGPAPHRGAPAAERVMWRSS
jgi:hypothetical protein